MNGLPENGPREVCRYVNFHQNGETFNDRFKWLNYPQSMNVKRILRKKLMHFLHFNSRRKKLNEFRNV